MLLLCITATFTSRIFYFDVIDSFKNIVQLLLLDRTTNIRYRVLIDRHQRCCRGASAKGGRGLKHMEGLFWSTKTTWGHFRDAEGPLKIGKILFFYRKNQYLRRKSTILKKFPKFCFKKIFYRIFFFKKIFLEKKVLQFFFNFSNFFENFENCRLKMQKSRFSGKFMGYQNHLRPFFPSQKPPGGKNRKRPPFNISDRHKD